jgi:putative PIN family toxin of toxin-antitoxin system
VRIVLDTNVLVAGLLNPTGTCGRLLDLVLEGVVLLCADERILQEYAEVLRRPSLALPIGAVRELLMFLRHSVEPVAPLPVAANLPDPSDLPFLEVAASAEAVLVTDNLRHFPKKAAGRVAVISPAELIEILRQLP